MTKRINFSAQSAAAARSAAQELARLRKSLRTAQDSIAGLRRSVHVPVPHGGKRTTPATRTSPSLLERTLSSAAGNFLAGGLLDEAGISSRLGSTFGSFYASDAQTGSFWSGIMQEGQRVS